MSIIQNIPIEEIKSSSSAKKATKVMKTLQMFTMEELKDCRPFKITNISTKKVESVREHEIS
jgi:ribosomal protein L31E